MRITYQEFKQLLDVFDQWTEGNQGNEGNEQECDLLERLENFLGENHSDPKHVDVTLVFD